MNLSFIKSVIYFFLRPLNLGAVGGGLIIKFPRIIKGNECIFLGENVRIASHAWIQCFKRYAKGCYNPRIEIGDNVQIGRYATITAIDSIKIGSNCLLSEYVYISDHAHNVFEKDSSPLVLRELIPKGGVSIGDFCFVGFRAIIMPGVMLGDRCVVGAGSVVTKSFPERSVIAGVPAKLIRSLV
jgi:lipopolysaccharide O-acetyltransferase